MFGYALLATAFYHALNDGKRSMKLLFLLTTGIVALYATSDEFHQMFTPGRSASIRDVGIDIAGGLMGIAFMRFVHKRAPVPEKEQTAN